MTDWFGGWLGGSSSGGGGSVIAAGGLTAEVVIEAAREKHPAFNRVAIPLPVALSALTDIQAELHGAAQQRETFYVVAKYQHLLSTFVADVPVPTHAGIAGGTVHLTNPAGGTEDLAIIGQGQRLEPPRRFAASLVNTQLTLVGTESYWADVSQVDVRYAPVAAALDDREDGLILPASARGAVVAMLALFMAERCAGLGQNVKTGPFASAAKRIVDSWLDTVAGVGTARPTKIRERP